MTGLSIPDPPQAAVDVFGQCQAIEAWAETVTDIGALRDTSAKLEAIDTYLARSSIEGRAVVATTMRRLEARIGELAGPASSTNGRPLGDDLKVLSHDERHDFRKMAAHRDVVEEVIADSTDEHPASRNAVLHAIDARREKKARDRAETRALIEELTPPGFDPVLNLRRIDALGALEACCREIATKLDTPADFLALTAPQLRAADVEIAERAHAWLSLFLIAVGKEQTA